jgi:NodT family efflux transporter outer membrane factor (OMF) lipoprotein
LAFGDSDLDQLIETALSDNFSLRIAWDRLRQSEAVARQFGAQNYPTLDGTAGASTRRESISGTETNTNNFSLGLVASYELDLWGRVRSNADATVLEAQATREQVQAAAITLSADIATVWFRLVEQNGRIEVLKEQVLTNENITELITLRFRRGQVDASDVLQQRQLTEVRRADLIQTESQAAVLRHRLAVLTSQSPESANLPYTFELQELPPLPAAGVPSELIERRPDIRSAELSVRSADERVGAAVANRFPRISISAQAGTSSSDASDLFDNWIASLGANLVAPIIDGGSRRAEVERTQAVLSERINTYGQTVLVAFNEVEDALVQESRQREFLDNLKRQIVISSQVVERTRERYLNGADDYLRVLSALLTDQQLQVSDLQARRQLIEFRINLNRALAGGWELTRPEPATLAQTSNR